MLSQSDYITDPFRLAALEGSALADSPGGEKFDQLTRLAARALNAPTALVSLVESDRQIFRSCVTDDAQLRADREAPLSFSFCEYVVAARRPVLINDTGIPEYARHPAISRYGIIAYIGVPLWSEGEVVGTFCVIDSKPRIWSGDDLDALTTLANAVMVQLELRLASGDPGAERYPMSRAQAVARRLWRSARKYREALDAYDRFVAEPHASVEDMLQEYTLRMEVTAARESMAPALADCQALPGGHPRADEAATPGSPEDLALGGVGICQVVSAYLAAAERQDQASADFQRKRIDLDEYELAWEATARAEDALRDAVLDFRGPASAAITPTAGTMRVRLPGDVPPAVHSAR